MGKGAGRTLSKEYIPPHFVLQPTGYLVSPASRLKLDKSCLFSTGREQHKILGFSDTEHEGFDFVLRSTAQNGEEVNAKHTSEFPVNN